MNTQTQIRIPRINHEIFVMGTQLFINPSAGVYYEPVGEGFTLDKFPLPSTMTQYGGVVYQDFEKMLTQDISHTLQSDPRYKGMPESDARKKFVADYTRGNLQGSASLLEKLNDKVVTDFKGRVLVEYENFGLPRRQLFGPGHGLIEGPELTDEERGNVANQYVEHVIVERASQPVRRIYALFTMNEGKDQAVMLPIVREFAQKYDRMVKSGSLHPLAAKKAQDFAVGLEGMLSNKHDAHL